MIDNRPCATHQWEPIPEERGQYVCIACCATGYRSQFHDRIVPHKKQRNAAREPLTAVPYKHHSYGGTGARIPPKPRSR